MAITYEDVQQVTLSDSTPQFNQPCSGFIVSSAGTIKIMTARNNPVTLAVNAGVIYPIATKQFFNTGTSGVGNVFAVVANPYKAWP
jgi:hypothetical protein